MIDATHDASRRSWVESANGHADFPLQNLPFGVFSPPGEGPRGGVAIGEMILDLPATFAGGWLDLVHRPAQAAAEPALNRFLAMGAGPRAALRAALFALLEEGSEATGKLALHRADACLLHLPATIGDYSDFFAGIHHAAASGALFRPENPLLPNYKYVPVGYHGRASSVVPSGRPVLRPKGQRKLPEETAPVFGPARNLDYELELGAWIGPGNDLGSPIPLAAAESHIAGFCLLNDWSARDIQAWEYQPLGPFLAKSFQTTISPWIVTAEAMAPFRAAQPPRPAGDPDPLPHLFDAGDQAHGGLDLVVEAWLATPVMRAEGKAPHRLSTANALHLYWSFAQMLTHHASGGCNLRPGDLLGSGTISAPGDQGRGCLLEMTRGGREPVTLPNGETRTYLRDGDEVSLTARASRPGFAGIGFGACTGMVLG